MTVFGCRFPQHVMQAGLTLAGNAGPLAIRSLLTLLLQILVCCFRTLGAAKSVMSVKPSNATSCRFADIEHNMFSSRDSKRSETLKA